MDRLLNQKVVFVKAREVQARIISLNRTLNGNIVHKEMGEAGAIMFPSSPSVDSCDALMSEDLHNSKRSRPFRRLGNRHVIKLSY